MAQLEANPQIPVSADQAPVEQTEKADLSQLETGLSRQEVEDRLYLDIAGTLSKGLGLDDPEAGWDKFAELKDELEKVREGPNAMAEMAKLQKKVNSEYEGLFDKDLKDQLSKIEGAENIKVEGKNASLEIDGKKYNLKLDDRKEIVAVESNGSTVRFEPPRRGTDENPLTAQEFKEIDIAAKNLPGKELTISPDEGRFGSIITSKEGERYKVIDDKLYKAEGNLDPDAVEKHGKANWEAYRAYEQLEIKARILDQKYVDRKHSNLESLARISKTGGIENEEKLQERLEEYRKNGATEEELADFKKSYQDFGKKRAEEIRLSKEAYDLELQEVGGSETIDIDRISEYENKLITPTGEYSSGPVTTVTKYGGNTETYYYDREGKLFQKSKVKQGYRNEGTNTVITTTEYDDSGKPIFEVDKVYGEDYIEKEYFVDKNGNRMGTYETELETNPDLTPEEYRKQYDQRFDASQHQRNLEITSRNYDTSQTYRALRSTEPGRAEINSRIDELEKKHGIEIDVDAFHGSTSKTKNFDTEELSTKLDEIETELEKYPPGFLKESGIKKITLADKPGFTVGSTSGDGNMVTEDGPTLHHEVHHHLDMNKPGGEEAGNQEWVDETHGPDGLDEYGENPNTKRDKDGRPIGFSSEYGQAGKKGLSKDEIVDEDQSEIAMSVLGNDREVLDKAKSDPVLAKKIDKIKKYYNKKSGGKMDDQYWKDLEAGKVGKDYWEKRQAS